MKKLELLIALNEQKRNEYLESIQNMYILGFVDIEEMEKITIKINSGFFLEKEQLINS